MMFQTEMMVMMGKMEKTGMTHDMEMMGKNQKLSLFLGQLFQYMKLIEMERKEMN